MIRVLHYGMSPNLGGIETYLLNLAQTIDTSRFHCDFLYSDQGQKPIFAPELTPLGSRFFGVTPRRTSPRANRADLDKLFAQEQFDVLHFHANTTSYVAPVRAALRHGVKVLYHSHNAGASRSRMTRMLHYWNQRTLPWHQIARVAVSREAGRWMFRTLPFHVVNNGISAERFAFSSAARRRHRAELGLAPHELALLSVAAFLPAKNHSFLLEVFNEVVKRRSDARLFLVGAGPLEDTVRRQAEQLGLGGRVTFLGRRSDVPGLMSAMDRFVLPSLHEGFPLVAIEAQAAGLPCLLSDRITSEVLASTFAMQLPLSAAPSVWADALAEEPQADRVQGAEVVLRSELSSDEATRRIEDIYLSL